MDNGGKDSASNIVRLHTATDAVGRSRRDNPELSAILDAIEELNERLIEQDRLIRKLLRIILHRD